jgi:uncharacterized protein
MRYRQVPKTGDRLSILGFGCMRLPTANGKIDEPRAIAQLRYAIDAGVNYLDTAWPYHAGESEAFLGKALREGYRDRVRLATKLPTWMIESRADMDRYLAAQLEKLATDHIDYYLLHALDRMVWDKMAALGAADFLDRSLADGCIRNAGFSFHGPLPDFKRIVDAYPWVLAQIQYNYFDENYQAGAEGLRYAAARGLAVVVMEPLRGGNLVRVVPPAVQAIWDGAEVRRTPVDWALRWVWNQPEVTVVLSGMSDESQVQENLTIADTARAGELTDDDLRLVRRVADKYRELMKVGCTGCGYCMPCPCGVKIPNCFEEYNKMYAFAAGEEAKFVYAFRLAGILGDRKPGYASQCIRCNACVERCPQHIAIPDVLSQVAAELEGPELPVRLAAACRIFLIEPQL